MDPDPSKVRILVVDDQPDTLRLFETYLSMAGFQVTATTSAADALRLAANGFEAISTDLAMPGMDGVEFIRRMREVRTERPIPIVAVTGQGSAATRELGDVGACRLLEKPCDLNELSQTLTDLSETCPHECTGCSRRRHPGR
ncbi:MAG: response regulator [Bacteroidales bacterium]